MAMDAWLWVQNPRTLSTVIVFGEVDGEIGLSRDFCIVFMVRSSGLSTFSMSSVYPKITGSDLDAAWGTLILNVLLLFVVPKSSVTSVATIEVDVGMKVVCRTNGFQNNSFLLYA